MGWASGRGQRRGLPAGDQGHPKRQAADIHQFIISPIEAHSKKPDETRKRSLPSWATGPAWSCSHGRPSRLGRVGQRGRADVRPLGHGGQKIAERSVFLALCECSQRSFQDQDENCL